MKLVITSLATASLALLLLAYSPKKTKDYSQPISRPKIQAAILLDVSGSMQGLIEQAKVQLWNMVTVMGKVECNSNYKPQFEIALYEYGRPDNGVNNGYIKQLSSFTTDLDGLSAKLFALQTDGGDEYCGEVIFKSVDELKWAAGDSSYKVIFIAGNEDFLQGSKKFTDACDLAKQKGIIVNTIYCGSYQTGITEHWNLQAECGQGSYSNINSDNKIDDIATPYDSLIIACNTKLNKTYVAFGYDGLEKVTLQGAMDGENERVSKKAIMKRAEAKADNRLYDNRTWDMVDAYRADSIKVLNMKPSELPVAWRNKNKNEIRGLINIQTAQRDSVQKEIIELSKKRAQYIADNTKSAAGDSNLETAIEAAIKTQIKRSYMRFKN
jgi:hypothetical protein